MGKKENLNIINATDNQLTKKRTIKAALMVVLGTSIFSFSIVWLFYLANLTSSGVTGVSQLIVTYVKELTGVSIPLAIPYIICNLPLVFIGYKYVSKRFLYLTLLSVGLQFTLLFVLEMLRDKLGWNPFNMFDPEADRFVLTALAGASAGFGAGICLKYGGSTGGTDIIANAFVIRKNGSFEKYSFIMDALIIICCGISFEGGLHFDFGTSIYTLIRLLFYLFSVAMVYDIYHLIDIRIITNKPEEMRTLLLEKKTHGFTVYEAKGGFTKEPKAVFEIIASSFELQDYIDIARYIDDHAFVISTRVKNISGNYIKKTIV